MKQRYFYFFFLTLLISCATEELDKSITDPDAELKACFQINKEVLAVGEDLVITNCSENATALEFNFGNGDTGTEENPVISYDESGEYIITLTVTNEDEESDTVTKTVNVISNEAFFIYPVIEDGFSAYPLEAGIHPGSGNLYYIELLEDEVGSEGNKFYYREKVNDSTLNWYYLADKPQKSNSAFVNFYPGGNMNFVFSRTLDALYGTQEVTYNSGWAFVNGIQSAQKHSYGYLEDAGTYLYYGTEKVGDFYLSAVERRNSSGDAFEVFANAIPGHENATIGDMIEAGDGYIAFGGVFSKSDSSPYISDYKPLLIFFDSELNITSHVVFEETEISMETDSSNDLNGSFHLEQLANGNLAMYAMGQLLISTSEGAEVSSEYFEDSDNNQALYAMENSFIISTKDYLKKFDMNGNLLKELHYGGQYLPEIFDFEDSLYFVAGYEEEGLVKLLYGATDENLNLIDLPSQIE